MSAFNVHDVSYIVMPLEFSMMQDDLSLRLPQLDIEYCESDGRQQTADLSRI